MQITTIENCPIARKPFVEVASRNFCVLLLTFENSLDADQDRQKVGPDLHPSCLILKDIFEKQ